MNPENHLVELVESRKDSDNEDIIQEFCPIEFLQESYLVYLTALENGHDISFHSHGSLSKTVILAVYDFDVMKNVYLEYVTIMKNNKEELEKFKKVMSYYTDTKKD